ncbi:hypothetical protein [Curtobacterium sp. MCBA15_013]|uniref:hypothetical protein n=1 Tax=Curtobacterium sp. MCBA15_013 TaxID=1898739 RepID=UPI0008DD391F|nr:hypothetical protein [Curtobacterium sp. MCBA15_013]OII18409.1 hypothetical protein BIV01_02365 [Curtobacterium sp. MCBA15_013]
MDLEEDFRRTVEETVAALRARQKPSREWKSSDGQRVVGWQFGRENSYGPTVKGNPARGWWEEVWGRSCSILGEDGRFHAYGFSGIEGSNYDGTVLSESLGPLSQSVLVGLTGKPFAKAKAELERMPYL